MCMAARADADSATVTTLEFNTQQLCQMAVRELDNLTHPVVTEGVGRYKILGTCVQTSEVVKKLCANSPGAWATRLIRARISAP